MQSLWNYCITTESQIQLRIATEIENLPLIADSISACMEKLDIEKGTLEVQLTVDEACTNIIKYAYSEYKGSILLICQGRHSDLLVTTRDTGRPFDPTSIVSPNLEVNLEERKVGGLEIYLIRKMVDDVRYSFDREMGNKLALWRKLTKET